MKLVDIVNSAILCILATLLVSGVGIGYLFAFYANPPVVYNVQPAPTNKAVYAAGETLYFLADRCKTHAVPFTIFKTWRGDIEIAQPPEARGGDYKADCKVSNFQVTIPKTLPPGTYYLHEKLIYHVLPFVDRKVNIRTTKFEVTE